jgi:hypothetical protein
VGTGNFLGFVPDNLRGAAKATGRRILIHPVILHWEDRATERVVELMTREDPLETDSIAAALERTVAIAKNVRTTTARACQATNGNQAQFCGGVIFAARVTACRRSMTRPN